MAVISPSRRLRRTPFSDGVEAAGVKAYTVYNRMLLPTVFESVEADYRHLKDHVQVWDVAVERQVELRGPDAGRLMQMLTPREAYYLIGPRSKFPGMAAWQAGRGVFKALAHSAAAGTSGSCPSRSWAARRTRRSAGI